MRRSLSFMLVLLLVLRGLLGDAMAMGVVPVAMPTAPVQHHAAVAVQPDAASQHHDHALAVEQGFASASACAVHDAGATDCGHGTEHTCSACGICHSALFPSAALAQHASLAPFALHPNGHTPFASAAAALAIKPPIS